MFVDFIVMQRVDDFIVMQRAILILLRPTKLISLINIDILIWIFDLFTFYSIQQQQKESSKCMLKKKKKVEVRIHSIGNFITSSNYYYAQSLDRHNPRCYRSQNPDLWSN